MTIPSDPHASDPTLTPEERDLAQRLSRLGGQREPAPALDARILAAAHDAVQASAAKRRHARRRWPMAFGVAASLTLAVGIAWRLRPLPDAEIAYSEAPVMAQRAAQAVTAAEPAATGRAADAPSSEADEGADLAQRVVIAPPEPAKPAERKAKSEPRRDAAADAEPDAFAAPEEATIVFDDPSPVDAPAPAAAPVAPPPPPPAPSALRPQAAPAPAPTTAAGAAANASKQADEARQQRARGALRRESNAAAEAEEASALDRIEVTGSRIDRFEDQPFDDQPPASADSPQVQQAWLQRIRELVARGKLDEARASLGEYRRRYPEQPLPDDLRALDE